MLGFDGQYSAGHPKATFWRFLVKICKISPTKQFIEERILLNFVNLSTTFCPRLYNLQKFLKMKNQVNLFFFWRGGGGEGGEGDRKFWIRWTACFVAVAIWQCEHFAKGIYSTQNKLIVLQKLCGFPIWLWNKVFFRYHKS